MSIRPAAHVIPNELPASRQSWQNKLRAVEPAILLVEPKLLRRIARVAQNVSSLVRRVPHDDVCVLDREQLLDLATEQELGIDGREDLRERVILIAWPGSDVEPNHVRRTLLRRLVHGWTHYHWPTVAKEQQEHVALQRVEQLGIAEWEEICTVAEQDRWLPQHGELAYATYQEFAARWWELRLAAPELLPVWFPGLVHQAERIDGILTQDVDIDQLRRKLLQAGSFNAVDTEKDSLACEFGVNEFPSEHASFCPAYGTGSESVSTAGLPDASREETVELLRELAAMRDSPDWQATEAAARRGNLVGAARRCWRQALRSSGPMRSQWQEQARYFLGQLTQRLRQVFPPKDEDQLANQDNWHEALWPLVPAAAQHGFFSQEARLLYDLQRLTEDVRRGVYVVDLSGWLRTFGRLAWRRQQPVLQQFLVLRRLRSAYQRLTLCRLAEPDQQKLASLLRSAIEHQEQALRQQVQPVLRQVLEEVGLVAQNLAERIEQERVVQELADSIVESGHLHLGQLRDAISRNQLKLPDLRGVGEWWRGDPLLAADRRLAHELDGVYRRGEVYLRWFQRLSSLFFGTWLGRLLSLFVLLPFGGAYIVLEGIDHVLVHPLAKWFKLDFHLSGRFQVLVLGLFLVGVINSLAFRRVVRQWCLQAWKGLRLVIWEWPRRLCNWPPLLRLWNAQLMVLFRRHLFLAAVSACIAWAACAWTGVVAGWSRLIIGLAALAGLFASLTREGHILLANLADYSAWSLRFLSWEWIVLGLNWIVLFFQRLLNYVELLQYRIDEWLRYRGGESSWQLVWKAAASLVWAWIAYLLRFTVYLLIEPQINPIKHFPVVTVSHKLLLAGVPFFSLLTMNALGWEDTPANRTRAIALVTSVIWAIPGIFGFLAWELKENWKLYQANRGRYLRPLRISHHGETMPQLLRPGVHSGTLRKLYRRARHLVNDATPVLSASQLDGWQKRLHGVAQAVLHFIDRNLTFPLRHCPSWTGPIPIVKAVRLGVTSVEIHLAAQPVSLVNASQADRRPAVLRFSNQGGWIVAEWREIGWLATLDPASLPFLQHALVGLYHWAGVEVVAEQLRQILPPRYIARLDWEGLLLYRRDESDARALYSWQESGLIPATNGTEEGWPSFAAQDLWFNARTLSWHDWQARWQNPQPPPVNLLPLASGLAQAVSVARAQ